MQSRNWLVVPPVSLERTLQVYIGEDRKSRSSDCFSVLASLSSYRCDLTFAYDNNKKKEKKEKKRVFWENLQDFISLGLLDIACFLAWYLNSVCID
jgi:hypothetical protein